MGILELAVAVFFISLLAVACGIPFFYYRQQKYEEGRKLMEGLAKPLNGHCVDQPGSTRPHLVFDHAGLRTRLKYEDYATTNDGVGTYPPSSDLKFLTVTTDGFDPTVNLEVGPTSFSRKIGAWFGGSRCESGHPIIDRDFVITSNKLREAMPQVFTHEVVAHLLDLSKFVFSESESKKTVGKKMLFEDEVQPREHVVVSNQQTDSIATAINSCRFLLKLNTGECSCQLLLHSSEEENLLELVHKILDIQVNLANNVVALLKQSPKKAF